MSARIQPWLDRFLSGVRWRPLWISVLATVLLVVYYHQGMVYRSEAFLAWAPSLTGVHSAPRLHRYLWSHGVGLILLMGVPLAACWLFEGWRPQQLGLRVRGTSREVALVVGLWLAFLPVVWILSDTAAFRGTYPGVEAAARNPRIFALHEALYLTKWIAWEFFFRGFLLFGLRKDLGGAAVIVSTVPFALMHFNKPELEMLGAIPSGLILCALALSCRSIWPGVLLHWLVAMSMDFFASEWWR